MSFSGLDQPAFNRHQLNAGKLIVFNKLEQLSASNWTRVALYRHTAWLVLCMTLATPAMAYKWPGDSPSLGGAISAKVIGKSCPGVLSAAEIAELEAYLARAASEQARENKERAGKDASYRPLPFDTFSADLTARYESKFRDPKACDADAAEEARDMLQRVRKTMAGGGAISPSDADPNRKPGNAEVILAKITGEKCRGALSAVEIAELEVYLAKMRLRFARAAADEDARVMMEQEKSAERAIADGFGKTSECGAEAVGKARDVAARVRRSESGNAE
jgi:hypothetical protein